MEDVRKEAEAIIREAEKEAKDTLLSAKEEANKQYATIMNDAKIKAEVERRKIESVTEVETRNRLLQRKEQLVNAAFDKALRQLTAFTKTEEYYSFLLDLIEETAAQLDSKKILLYLNATDKKRLTQKDLKNLSKKLGIQLEISESTEDCIGGCKLQTPDEKILYDNTIENRLQQLKPSLRVEIAKELFGKEEQKNAD